MRISICRITEKLPVRPCNPKRDVFTYTEYQVHASKSRLQSETRDAMEPAAVIEEVECDVLINEALTRPVADRQYIYQQVNDNLRHAEHHKLTKFYTECLHADSDQMSKEYYRFKEQVVRETECETLDVKYRDNIVAVVERMGCDATRHYMNIPRLEDLLTELNGLIQAQKANYDELVGISWVLPTIHITTHLTTPNPIWVDLFDLLRDLFDKHDHNRQYPGWNWNRSADFAKYYVTVTLPTEVANMLPRLFSGTDWGTYYFFPLCMPTVFMLTSYDWSSFQEDKRLLLQSFGVILDFKNYESKLRIQNLSPRGPKLCLPEK